MTEAAPLLADLDTLEQAVDTRAAAWAEEEAAWGEVERALAATNVAALVGDLAHAASEVTRARREVAADVAALTAAGGALADELHAAAEALHAIVHDPAAAGWHAAGTALIDSGTAAAGHLDQAEEALVQALGHTAVTHVAQAEETVHAAVGAFHDALPEAVRTIATESAALGDKVSSVGASFHAALVAHGAQLQADARNLGLSLLRRQLGHQARVLEQVAGFGARLEAAARAVHDLGGEVGRLRAGLDGAVQGSLRPIDDIRVILHNFHEKFGSL